MEAALSASTELSLLGWSVILLLLQVVAQATAASDLRADLSVQSSRRATRIPAA